MRASPWAVPKIVFGGRLRWFIKIWSFWKKKKSAYGSGRCFLDLFRPVKWKRSEIKPQIKPCLRDKGDRWLQFALKKMKIDPNGQNILRFQIVRFGLAEVRFGLQISQVIFKIDQKMRKSIFMSKTWSTDYEKSIENSSNG